MCLSNYLCVVECLHVAMRTFSLGVSGDDNYSCIKPTEIIVLDVHRPWFKNLQRSSLNFLDFVICVIQNVI